MKTVFISNNWADAHQQTRLRALHRHGIALTCLAFSREYYEPVTSFRPVWMGEMAHASYLNRWKTYLRFLKNLRAHTSPGDSAYVFGFDLITFVYLYNLVSGKRLTLVYEIPDIREMFFSKGLQGTFLRMLEARIVPGLDLLVVTSRAYVTEYFVKWRGIRLREFLVLENKVHPDQLPGPPPPVRREGGKITIGYFGLLRCPASLECLVRLAQSGGYDVLLAGIFMPATAEYEAMIRSTEGMEYVGPYKVPSGLSPLYGRVDVVWAAYPHSSEAVGNHRWARTNRFYEGLYFKKPLVLGEGTNDARAAEALGLPALVVDLKDSAAAADYVASNLDTRFINSFRQAHHELPASVYQITDEYRTLACFLLQKK